MSPGRSPDRPGVIAPPPLIYVGFMLVGWGLQRLIPLDGAALPARSVVGPACVLLGFVLSAWSVLSFIKHGTHPDPYHPTTRLITDGPFRRSRNPIYVAFALMHVGIGWWLSNPWIVYTVLPALALVAVGVVRPEERYLAEKFGAEYERYRTKVRRWL